MHNAIKFVIATSIAGAATFAAWHATRPAALTSVAVVTQPVAAWTPLSPTSVAWLRVANPPAGAITQPQAMAHFITNAPLAAGTILTLNDNWSVNPNGLHAGEVQWIVPVTESTSGLAGVGQRVDVWDVANGQPILIAQGVRVIGLFTSNGQPILASTPAMAASSTGDSTNNPGSVGLMALAVPAQDMSVLLGLANPAFVVDPNATHFVWRWGGPPSAPR